MVRLIFGKRNQRADDQRHSVTEDAGQLIAQAFTSPGWHQHDRVFASHDRLACLALTVTKGLEPEATVQVSE
jgi:hypothetical protein